MLESADRAPGLSRPRPRLLRRLASGVLLSGVCLVLSATTFADELPDPVIRKVDAAGRRVPVAPPAARRPVRPTPRATPPPAPSPRPMAAPQNRPPPIVPMRSVPRPPGSTLPDPVIRRIPGDPSSVIHPRQPAAPQANPATPGATLPPMSAAPGAAPRRPRPDEAPPPAPVRPRDKPAQIPGDVSLEVDPQDGLLEGIDEGGDVAAIVMLGNPHVRRSASTDAQGKGVPSFSIKATKMVVWVDRSEVPALQGFSGASRSLGGQGTAPRTDSADRPVDLGDKQNVVPQALREIYAEGAVELIFDDVVFRAEKLYLDPHRYVALFVRPEFDGYAAGSVIGSRRVPIHVRAREARLIGRGLTVFEDVDVSTSRADDRIRLRGEVLTVQEFEEGRSPDAGGEPHILGYRRSSTQEYALQRIRVEGERIPIFYWPSLRFGLSTQGQAFSSIIKGIDVGRRSHLGNFGFLTLGGDLIAEAGRTVSWEADLGGYLGRGPAAGGELTWDSWEAATGLRSRGLLEGHIVHDFDADDRDGFVAPSPSRWRIHTESRTRLNDDLHFDVEVGAFSDRGFNFEYFERDELTHKDYESYGRLYWAPSRVNGVVGTLTGKWHQRDFVTETTLGPQAALWLTGVPLLVPTRRGGLAVDVTSMSNIGRLGRRFDEDLPLVDYESWRLSTETRINMGFDIGDVRVSGWAGGVADRYVDRDDGGQDLTRAAALLGLRTNLQLSKVWAAQGGPLRLDGLRHVIDLDAEVSSRVADSHRLAEVPAFDRAETEEEHTRVTLRMRNRLQTREGEAERRADTPLAGYQLSTSLRNVLDWELSLHHYINDQGPYGRRTPGAVETTAVAALHPNLNVIGELLVDFEKGTQTGVVGLGYTTGPEVGRLNVGAGVRYVRDESLSLRGDLEWRWSQKYALRTQWAYDFRDALSVLRVVVRRYSDDHIWEAGFRIRDDSFGIEFSLDPAIGGQTTKSDKIFEDEPSLNPRGFFK